MNKNMENGLRSKLKDYGDSMEIDEAQKNQVLQTVSRAALKKADYFKPGWCSILKLQLIGLPAKTLGLQFFFLLLIPGVEYMLRNYIGVNGWQIFPPLSIFMAAGGLILINGLSRHFSHHMAELEQTCCLNLSQMWLIQAVTVSILDGAAVLVLSGFRSEAYGFGWFSFAVYVLTPFFAANAILLFIFTLGREKGRLPIVAAVVLAVGGFALQSCCSWIYERTWIPIWFLGLAVVLGFWGLEMNLLKRKLEGKGENLCWN